MTLVANESATRAEALRFPKISVVTAASSLEKALSQHFKQRLSGFWDMDLYLGQVRHGDVEFWHDYATRIRDKFRDEQRTWLPAGKATDRRLKAGAWMGLPLTGGGFGAAMLVAKPEPHQRLFSDAVVMVMRRRWERWPTMSDVENLQPEDGAYISQTSMICVRDGRWRVLGYASGFDPEAWVWPMPWSSKPRFLARHAIMYDLDKDRRIEIVLGKSLLRLDPDAGSRMAGSMDCDSIGMEAARILNGTYVSPEGSDRGDGLVTPERLAAWRKINAAIRLAIEEKRYRLVDPHA